jgi:phospholipid/cholesterol/gamma-HCH transport system substrate-binding protein
MRFRVRFADQIVGILTIAALLGVIVVIFILGSHQRWFARDYRYKAYFESAVGLSANMPVLYKGFTIGNVKNVHLTESDTVEVTIAIFDSYVDRVREGSLVALNVSPIGLGNQFLFYAGLGSRILDEGETIPIVHSPEAKSLEARGIAAVPPSEEGISLLLARTTVLVENIDALVLQMQRAFAGETETSLGRIVLGAEDTLGSVSGMAEDLRVSLAGILEEVRPMVANLETVSEALADPQGTVAAVLDGSGPVYTNLEASLKSITGILWNLEKASDFIPAKLPEIAGILSDLQTALETAQDVLTALTNNPLLKRGVPGRVQTRTTGAGSRDVSF